jgi:predicted amidohydrolase YtcJ
MISNSESDLNYFEENGPILKDLLRVQSVKAYLDGALGSRGALLRAPYHDLPQHYGLPLLSPQELDKLRDRCVKNDWQLCVHAIGDSAHRILLKSFNKLDTTFDLRFRVEHAQIMTPEDSAYYSHPNIVASIQPTHATSDMYWAENRLGAQRMNHAYSYKRILNASGLIALGTDFPIEDINPLHTFFAAVDRTDKYNWPENGFLADQKLSAEQALHGMTYGASYSAFGENDYGSITIGQKANFTVLNQNLFDSIQRDRKTCKVEHTIISGDLVYSR